jgi:NADPH-dependent curcumin reductase CurA
MADRGGNEGLNLQLYLKRVPHGIAGPDDFEVRETQIPEIGDSEVLIRSHYLGVDAALRLIVRDSKDFLFRVQPGDLVRGTVAGEVIESNHPGYSVGEQVLASAGMQNYAVSDGSDL